MEPTVKSNTEKASPKMEFEDHVDPEAADNPPESNLTKIQCVEMMQLSPQVEYCPPLNEKQRLLMSGLPDDQTLHVSSNVRTPEKLTDFSTAQESTPPDKLSKREGDEFLSKPKTAVLPKKDHLAVKRKLSEEAPLGVISVKKNLKPLMATAKPMIPKVEKKVIAGKMITWTKSPEKSPLGKVLHNIETLKSGKWPYSSFVPGVLWALIEQNLANPNYILHCYRQQKVYLQKSWCGTSAERCLQILAENVLHCARAEIVVSRELRAALEEVARICANQAKSAEVDAWLQEQKLGINAVAAQGGQPGWMILAKRRLQRVVAVDGVMPNVSLDVLKQYPTWDEAYSLLYENFDVEPLAQVNYIAPTRGTDVKLVDEVVEGQHGESKQQVDLEEIQEEFSKAPTAGKDQKINLLANKGSTKQLKKKEKQQKKKSKGTEMTNENQKRAIEEKATSEKEEGTVSGQINIDMSVDTTEETEKGEVKKDDISDPAVSMFVGVKSMDEAIQQLLNN